MPLKIHTTWNGRLYVDADELRESPELKNTIRRLRGPSPGNYEPSEDVKKLSTELANAKNEEEKREVAERVERFIAERR